MASTDTTLPSWKSNTDETCSPRPSYVTAAENSNAEALNMPHQLTVRKGAVIIGSYFFLILVVTVLPADFAKPATRASKFISNVVFSSGSAVNLTVIPDTVGWWMQNPPENWRYSWKQVVFKLILTSGALFFPAAFWKLTPSDHCKGYPAGSR